MRIEIEVPDKLNKSTIDLVKRFAEELAIKLRKAEVKYGYTNKWKNDDWRYQCANDLIDHIVKGDPLDVAIYCAFMWHHGWKTSIKTVTRIFAE